MHSDRSDGRHPADAVLEQAVKGRLDVIALADHDLPNVLTPGVHELKGRSLRVLAAAEVSGSHEGKEFHLLAYFPGSMPESFRDFLRERARSRAERYDTAVRRLPFADVPLSDDDARDGRRSLTRHHLYRALRERGHVRDAREGFALIGGATVVPLIDISYLEAIRAARAAGAFTSWAHPSFDDAERHVARFAAEGLRALEGVRPGIDRRTRNGLRGLAERHRLLLTGGSDYHGWHDPPLGTFAFTGERARSFLEALDGQAAA
jgi:predicted metal-dependent phosphoesterase TrpH